MGIFCMAVQGMIYTSNGLPTFWALPQSKIQFLSSILKGTEYQNRKWQDGLDPAVPMYRSPYRVLESGILKAEQLAVLSEVENYVVWTIKAVFIGRGDNSFGSNSQKIDWNNQVGGCVPHNSLNKSKKSSSSEEMQAGNHGGIPAIESQLSLDMPARRATWCSCKVVGGRPEHSELSQSNYSIVSRIEH
ncbi:hypothetical protein D5086_025089 [Populus alba]|uniref:Uncharacterized protein n=1 Tax=Populus alba TaxID=43335 RepID=A0ACC4B872_POPAL